MVEFIKELIGTLDAEEKLKKEKKDAKKTDEDRKKDKEEAESEESGEKITFLEALLRGAAALTDIEKKKLAAKKVKKIPEEKGMPFQDALMKGIGIVGKLEPPPSPKPKLPVKVEARAPRPPSLPPPSLPPPPPAEEKLFCPRCNSVVGLRELSCRVCGAEFVEGKCACIFCGTINELNAQICANCETPLMGDANTLCPICKNYTNLYAKRCTTCGAEFELDKCRCSACGSIIPVDAKVCPECGSVLIEISKKPAAATASTAGSGATK